MYIKRAFKKSASRQLYIQFHILPTGLLSAICSRLVRGSIIGRKILSLAFPNRALIHGLLPMSIKFTFNIINAFQTSLHTPMAPDRICLGLALPNLLACYLTSLISLLRYCSHVRIRKIFCSSEGLASYYSTTTISLQYHLDIHYSVTLKLYFLLPEAGFAGRHL